MAPAALGLHFQHRSPPLLAYAVLVHGRCFGQGVLTADACITVSRMPTVLGLSCAAAAHGPHPAPAALFIYLFASQHDTLYLIYCALYCSHIPSGVSSLGDRLAPAGAGSVSLILGDSPSPRDADLMRPGCALAPSLGALDPKSHDRSPQLGGGAGCLLPSMGVDFTRQAGFGPPFVSVPTWLSPIHRGPSHTQLSPPIPHLFEWRGWGDAASPFTSTIIVMALLCCARSHLPRCLALRARAAPFIRRLALSRGLAILSVGW